MNGPSTPTLAEQLAAAHDWWREAGVDCGFADEPRNWLARPAAPATVEEPSPAVAATPTMPDVPPLGGDPASWPRELSTFAGWWLDEPSLETGGTAPRVAPRGVAEAELMVLVPMPEAGDAARLLSGAQGRLVANMLVAMGLAEERAYLAAALPRHVSHPDWAALAQRRLGEVLLHQFNLVHPKRLLLLGRAMLPLFGHDPAQSTPATRKIALQGCDVPALVSYGPEALLETARFRAGLWRGWLEWTEGDE